MNQVYSLPDSYAKPIRGREAETATNTWKLFQIGDGQSLELQEEIEQLMAQLDIYHCTGDALTRLGEMYGVTRTTQDDTVYRAEILGQIMKGFGGSTADSVLQKLATACGVSASAFRLQETAPATVRLSVAMADLDRVPLSTTELRALLLDLLAAGVGVETEIGTFGTFRYCADGDEKSPAYDGMGYGEGTLASTYI